MNEIPPPHETEPAPVALTSDNPSIRVSQEEFIDETSEPSMDRSEYERRKAQGEGNPPLRPANEGEETTRTEQH